MKTPTFSRQDPMKFFRTLNTRVNDYFKENNIKKTVKKELEKECVSSKRNNVAKNE